MSDFRDPVYSKCLNSLQQVTARGGQPILICEAGDTETQEMTQVILRYQCTMNSFNLNKTKLRSIEGGDVSVNIIKLVLIFII